MHTIQKVKRRLTAIYTCSTAVILSVVVMALFLFTRKQEELNQMQQFQNYVTLVVGKLQGENKISNSWMAQMEADYHLMIQVEENGTPLYPHGSWMAQDKRDEMVRKVKNRAGEDGMDLDTNPVLLNDMIAWYGNEKEYYSAAIMIPMKDTYRSAILVKYFQNNSAKTKRLLFWYLLADLAGILGLYVVIRHLTGITLKPVEESKQEQVSFIAAASHELKSPLAVIRTSNAAIGAMPEKTAFYRENIEKECERMARLVDDLLLLSSIEAKKWTVWQMPMEVDTVLIQSFEELKGLGAEKNITLELSLPEEVMPPAKGDPQRLFQVIGILLDNAFCYAEGTEKVILKAYVRKNRICIEVIDFGKGIQKKNQKKVFERFFQEEEGRNQKNHFGLGLSIAKELVSHMGGMLTLLETKGGGCTFHFEIPL